MAVNPLIKAMVEYMMTRPKRPQPQDEWDPGEPNPPYRPPTADSYENYDELYGQQGDPTQMTPPGWHWQQPRGENAVGPSWLAAGPPIPNGPVQAHGWMDDDEGLIPNPLEMHGNPWYGLPSWTNPNNINIGDLIDPRRKLDQGPQGSVDPKMKKAYRNMYEYEMARILNLNRGS